MVDAACIYAVVGLHYAITLLPPLGALLILRWPRFFWIHLPLLVWAYSIPFVQWPCPLTDLEKSLRASAGWPVYQGHFVQHYFEEPLGPGGATIWGAFNVVAVLATYGYVMRQRRARPA